MIRVAIAGIKGNMGRALASAIEAAPDMLLVGGSVRPGTHQHNGRNGLLVVDRLECLLPQVDVVIDVSTTRAIMDHALACVLAGKPLVAGVRGLDPNHLAELEEYSRRIPVFYSANFCIEAAAVLSLLPALLEKVPHLDIEISGIGSNQRRQTVQPSQAGSPVLDSADDPIVYMVGRDQEIMLSQRGYGREAHARGALAAARLVAGRASGFYTMEDLLASGLTGYDNQDTDDQRQTENHLTSAPVIRSLHAEQLSSHQR